MQPEIITALCSVIAALVALIGKLVYDRRPKTPSGRPPPRSMLPRHDTPKGLGAAVDMPKMADQIDDLHECHLGQHAYDEDGVPKWWNKPSLERAIRELREHSQESASQSKRQNKILEELPDKIAAAISRAPSP